MDHARSLALWNNGIPSSATETTDFSGFISAVSQPRLTIASSRRRAFGSIRSNISYENRNKASRGGASPQGRYQITTCSTLPVSINSLNMTSQPSTFRTFVVPTTKHTKAIAIRKKDKPFPQFKLHSKYSMPLKLPQRLSRKSVIRPTQPESQIGDCSESDDATYRNGDRGYEKNIDPSNSNISLRPRPSLVKQNFLQLSFDSAESDPKDDLGIEDDNCNKRAISSFIRNDLVSLNENTRPAMVRLGPNNIKGDLAKSNQQIFPDTREFGPTKAKDRPLPPLPQILNNNGVLAKAGKLSPIPSFSNYPEAEIGSTVYLPATSYRQQETCESTDSTVLLKPQSLVPFESDLAHTTVGHNNNPLPLYDTVTRTKSWIPDRIKNLDGGIDAAYEQDRLNKESDIQDHRMFGDISEDNKKKEHAMNERQRVERKTKSRSLRAKMASLKIKNHSPEKILAFETTGDNAMKQLQNPCMDIPTALEGDSDRISYSEPHSISFFSSNNDTNLEFEPFDPRSQKRQEHNNEKSSIKPKTSLISVNGLLNHRKSSNRLRRHLTKDTIKSSHSVDDFCISDSLEVTSITSTSDKECENSDTAPADLINKWKPNPEIPGSLRPTDSLNLNLYQTNEKHLNVPIISTPISSPKLPSILGPTSPVSGPSGWLGASAKINFEPPPDPKCSASTTLSENMKQAMYAFSQIPALPPPNSKIYLNDNDQSYVPVETNLPMYSHNDNKPHPRQAITTRIEPIRLVESNDTSPLIPDSKKPGNNHFTLNLSPPILQSIDEEPRFSLNAVPKPKLFFPTTFDQYNLMEYKKISKQKSKSNDTNPYSYEKSVSIIVSPASSVHNSNRSVRSKLFKQQPKSLHPKSSKLEDPKQNFSGMNGNYDDSNRVLLRHMSTYLHTGLYSDEIIYSDRDPSKAETWSVPFPLHSGGRNNRPNIASKHVEGNQIRTVKPFFTGESSELRVEEGEGDVNTGLERYASGNHSGYQQDKTRLHPENATSRRPNFHKRRFRTTVMGNEALKTLVSQGSNSIPVTRNGNIVHHDISTPKKIAAAARYLSEMPDPHAEWCETPQDVSSGTQDNERVFRRPLWLLNADSPLDSRAVKESKTSKPTNNSAHFEQTIQRVEKQHNKRTLEAQSEESYSQMEDLSDSAALTWATLHDSSIDPESFSNKIRSSEPTEFSTSRFAVSTGAVSSISQYKTPVDVIDTEDEWYIERTRLPSIYANNNVAKGGKVKQRNDLKNRWKAEERKVESKERKKDSKNQHGQSQMHADSKEIVNSSNTKQLLQSSIPQGYHSGVSVVNDIKHIESVSIGKLTPENMRFKKSLQDVGIQFNSRLVWILHCHFGSMRGARLAPLSVFKRVNAYFVEYLGALVNTLVERTWAFDYIYVILLEYTTQPSPNGLIAVASMCGLLCKIFDSKHNNKDIAAFEEKCFGQLINLATCSAGAIINEIPKNYQDEKGQEDSSEISEEEQVRRAFSINAHDLKKGVDPIKDRFNHSLANNNEYTQNDYILENSKQSCSDTAIYSYPARVTLTYLLSRIKVTKNMVEKIVKIREHDPMFFKVDKISLRCFDILWMKLIVSQFPENSNIGLGYRLGLDDIKDDEESDTDAQLQEPFHLASNFATDNNPSIDDESFFGKAANPGFGGVSGLICVNPTVNMSDEDSSLRLSPQKIPSNKIEQKKNRIHQHPKDDVLDWDEGKEFVKLCYDETMIIISLEHNTTIRNMYYQVFPELNSKAARFPFDKTFSIQKLLSILDSAPTHLLQDVMEIVLLSLNKYEPFKGKNRRRRRRRKPSDRNEKAQFNAHSTSVAQDHSYNNIDYHDSKHGYLDGNNTRENQSDSISIPSSNENLNGEKKPFRFKKLFARRKFRKVRRAKMKKREHHLDKIQCFSHTSLPNAGFIVGNDFNQSQNLPNNNSYPSRFGHGMCQQCGQEHTCLCGNPNFVSFSNSSNPDPVDEMQKRHISVISKLSDPRLNFELPHFESNEGSVASPKAILGRKDDVNNGSPLIPLMSIINDSSPREASGSESGRSGSSVCVCCGHNHPYQSRQKSVDLCDIRTWEQFETLDYQSLILNTIVMSGYQNVYSENAIVADEFSFSSRNQNTAGNLSEKYLMRVETKDQIYETDDEDRSPRAKKSYPTYNLKSGSPPRSSDYSKRVQEVHFDPEPNSPSTGALGAKMRNLFPRKKQADTQIYTPNTGDQNEKAFTTSNYNETDEEYDDSDEEEGNRTFNSLKSFISKGVSKTQKSIANKINNWSKKNAERQMLKTPNALAGPGDHKYFGPYGFNGSFGNNGSHNSLNNSHHGGVNQPEQPYQRGKHNSNLQILNYQPNHAPTPRGPVSHNHMPFQGSPNLRVRNVLPGSVSTPSQKSSKSILRRQSRKSPVRRKFSKRFNKNNLKEGDESAGSKEDQDNDVIPHLPRTLPNYEGSYESQEYDKLAKVLREFPKGTLCFSEDPVYNEQTAKKVEQKKVQNDAQNPLADQGDHQGANVYNNGDDYDPIMRSSNQRDSTNPSLHYQVQQRASKNLQIYNPDIEWQQSLANRYPSPALLLEKNSLRTKKGDQTTKKETKAQK